MFTFLRWITRNQEVRAAVSTKSKPYGATDAIEVLYWGGPTDREPGPSYCVRLFIL